MIGKSEMSVKEMGSGYNIEGTHCLPPYWEVCRTTLPRNTNYNIFYPPMKGIMGQALSNSNNTNLINL